MYERENQWKTLFSSNFPLESETNRKESEKVVKWKSSKWTVSEDRVLRASMSQWMSKATVNVDLSRYQFIKFVHLQVQRQDKRFHSLFPTLCYIFFLRSSFFSNNYFQKKRIKWSERVNTYTHILYNTKRERGDRENLKKWRGERVTDGGVREGERGRERLSQRE